MSAAVIHLALQYSAPTEHPPPHPLPCTRLCEQRQWDAPTRALWRRKASRRMDVPWGGGARGDKTLQRTTWPPFPGLLLRKGNLSFPFRGTCLCCDQEKKERNDQLMGLFFPHHKYPSNRGWKGNKCKEMCAPPLQGLRSRKRGLVLFYWHPRAPLIKNHILELS